MNSAADSRCMGVRTAPRRSALECSGRSQSVRRSTLAASSDPQTRRPYRRIIHLSATWLTDERRSHVQYTSLESCSSTRTGRGRIRRHGISGKRPADDPQQQPEPDGRQQSCHQPCPEVHSEIALHRCSSPSALLNGDPRAALQQEDARVQLARTPLGVSQAAQAARRKPPDASAPGQQPHARNPPA